MSDLFHENVEFAHIVAIFRVMAIAQHHTFQILTKRPQRMLEVMNLLPEALKTIFPAEKHPEVNAPGWPLPNVWLGVSVENQRAADERIPLLLQTPAAVRFLSCEPLLGPVDLKPYLEPYIRTKHDGSKRGTVWADPGIDWIIVGGESGPGARPMHPDWVRGIRDQCVAAGVPFFFKQWGEWKLSWMAGEYQWMRVGKKAAGRLLDGRTWDELPVVAKAPPGELHLIHRHTGTRKVIPT
jgi:protein gp37